MTEGKQFVLIGHPVGHSLSPAIHRAAYQALGLDHSYEAIDCSTDSQVRQQIQRVREGEVAGANVTVPHKLLALASADHVDQSAQAVKAANVLLCDAQGRVVAHNTDALALADELGQAAPGRSAVVIGNGGAALAAVVACRQLGMTDVWVTARRFIAEQPQTQWPMSTELVALGAKLLAWPGSSSSNHLQQVIERAAFLIQATSSGMKGADSGEEVAQIIPWSGVPEDALVYDLVYNPAVTPFLRRAQQRQLQAKNGLGMLVGQAARAFSLWLGVAAPVVAMRTAAEQALARQAP